MGVEDQQEPRRGRQRFFREEGVFCRGERGRGDRGQGQAQDRGQGRGQAQGRGQEGRAQAQGGAQEGQGRAQGGGQGGDRDEGGQVGARRQEVPPRRRRALPLLGPLERRVRGCVGRRAQGVRHHLLGP